MRLDLFCHVVDNFGDVGVSWRLATNLAARGADVRLWIDDPSALAWMAPDGAPGVQVLHWTEPLPDLEPADVVIENFGCRLPDAFVQRMHRPRPPLWINLEYLSAEDYVERSHALPSPQHTGVAAGLTKWFLYPGFTDRTAGLLRESGLLQARDAFDRDAWLREQGMQREPHERVVSLFCYANAQVAPLLRELDRTPTLLLVTPGLPAEQVRACRREDVPHAQHLRIREVPFLSQPQFDRLLWACDLNFVRGEESFVRAQWAAHPFVWHIYPQVDGVHARKLEAFLDHYLDAAAAPLADHARRLMRRWNGLTSAAPGDEADWVFGDERRVWSPWQAHARAWADRLARHEDLVSRLLAFIAAKGLTG
jgi:uncharacterized repeat protein (TIGR03837 family)